MSKTDESWAIICGWYINAFSIVTALRNCGWVGHIVCLKDRSDGVVFMELVKPSITIMETNHETPEGIIDFILENFPANDKKYIFFTDEIYLPVFRSESIQPQLKNTFFYVGSTTYLDGILDRYKFYHLIEEAGAGPVPLTIAADEDPWRIFTDGFFIRPRYTWKGMQKLERVKRVDCQQDLIDIVSRWRDQGLVESDWCYQEILSVRPKDNISISGWHDAKQQKYVATRHILRHPDDVGNGDVTEVIPSPPGLLKRTALILNYLEYSGPFELEFIFDANDDSYKPIELNPRFWMQHGLIEAITGDFPVRQYVGFDGVVSKPEGDIKIWVYSFYSLFRLLRRDWRILPFLRRRNKLVVPPFSLALRWSLHYLRHKRVARNRPQ